MNKKIISICFFNFLYVFFVFAGEIPEEFQSFSKDLRAYCIEKSGVHGELIELAVKGLFVKDRKLGCYSYCVAQQLGLVTDEKMDFKKFLILTPPRLKEKSKVLVSSCKDTKGTDSCDLAYNINYCFYKTYPVEFFII
uniref:Odorant-binding protein n=1 Tax=Aphidius gifuensis TaxID=684658 RepID=A0A3S9LWG1_APHGI|nr:odorant-binding protein [Aphidius gifuensis]